MRFPTALSPPSPPFLQHPSPFLHSPLNIRILGEGNSFLLGVVIPSRWVGGAWHPSSACTPLSSSRSRISAKQRRTEVPAGFPQLLAHVLPLLSGKSFREQQCEKYNGYNLTDLEGNRLEWVPKYAGVSPRDRCKLFCRARGRSEFKVFEAKVRYSVMLSCPTYPVSGQMP